VLPDEVSIEEGGEVRSGEQAFLEREYQRLDKEVADSHRLRIQIIALSLAATGALFAGSVAIEPYRRVGVTLLVFGVGLPAGLILGYGIWFAELERMVRAGNYLTLLEADINVRIGTTTLRWEGWLRAGHGHMKYPYVAATGLFLGPAAVFPFVGVQLAGVDLWDHYLSWYAPCVCVILAGTAATWRVINLQRKADWVSALATGYQSGSSAPTMGQGRAIR
jgi:hypothetical protein